jgi:hypothetical protein
LSVTYRASLVFNIEVARLRAEKALRLVRSLLSKAGQYSGD